MSSPATFGIVGHGWRAQFFARLARLLPEHLALVGAVVRRPEAAAHVTQQWGVPAYLSPADLVAHQHPRFVISSVPSPATPGVITALVESGARVLAETPRPWTRWGCATSGRR